MRVIPFLVQESGRPGAFPGGPSNPDFRNLVNAFVQCMKNCGISIDMPAHAFAVELEPRNANDRLRRASLTKMHQRMGNARPKFMLILLANDDGTGTCTTGYHWSHA